MSVSHIHWHKGECRIIRPDGSISWIYDKSKIIFDENNSPIRVDGTVSDITERKEAEEALRRSHVLLADAQRVGHVGSWELDVKTHALWWSDETYRIFGFRQGEFKNTMEAFFEMVHPDDRPQMQKLTEDNWQDRKPFDGVHRIIRPDGAVRIIHEQAETTFDDSGQPARMIGTVRDITEHKRAEEALRTKTLLLEAQSETSIDGILAVDNEGHSLLFNKRFGEIWKIPQGVLDAKDDKKMLEYVLKYLKDPVGFTRKAAYLYEHTDEKSRDEIEFLDGNCFDRYSSPLRDSAGKYYGRIWYFRDITERKRAAESLRRAHDELEQRVEERTKELHSAKLTADAANRAKSDFLANMSHELRTPLSAIIGFSELLDEKLFGALNPKQEEYVKDILGSGQHLLSLINDILDLTKIEAGKMELELSSFPVATLLENSLVMVKEKCLKQGIRLVTDIAGPVKDLVISADERKLKQIMFNLLANAVKFSPAGGAITVSAQMTPIPPHSHTPILLSPQTPTLLISVSDTGIGIAKKHQPRLFEEFFQVTSRAHGKPAGTGLGLSLVKRMVEQHGGRVWVESPSTPLRAGEEGKGSTFRFAIPLSPAQGLVQAIRAHLAVSNGKPGGLVLSEAEGPAVVLFTLDADADGNAMPAADKGKGAKPDDVWAALAEKVRTPGSKSAFSGNEFIVTAALNNNDDTAVLAKLRRLLKDVLFQMAPSAVAGFSCGMATWTAKMHDTAELLEAARGAQVHERDRIAAQRIVVVDDESLFRKMLGENLKQLGFVNVDEAAGGEDLFRLLQSQIPDLIVLDLFMPGMNGYEVIGRLKGHLLTAKIPILILSGGDVDSSKLHDKSPATAIHVLVKPVNIDMLNSRVSHLL